MFLPARLAATLRELVPKPDRPEMPKSDSNRSDVLNSSSSVPRSLCRRFRWCALKLASVQVSVILYTVTN